MIAAKSLTEQVMELRQIVPPEQLFVLVNNLKGEEKKYFANVLNTQSARLKECPRTYGTENMKGKAVAYFRYFLGDSWALVTELDVSGPPHIQAYGYVSLNGYYPEPGYIHIPQLIAAGFELDLHYEPQTLADAKLWKD